MNPREARQFRVLPNHRLRPAGHRYRAHRSPGRRLRDGRAALPSGTRRRSARIEQPTSLTLRNRPERVSARQAQAAPVTERDSISGPACRQIADCYWHRCPVVGACAVGRSTIYVRGRGQARMWPRLFRWPGGCDDGLGDQYLVMQRVVVPALTDAGLVELRLVKAGGLPI